MPLSERFKKAFDLHSDHYPKQTEIPYVTHLMSVACLTLEHGASEDEAISALLHDSNEDQAHKMGGSDALCYEIEARFGKAVLEIVKGCSDSMGEDKAPWRKRKDAYLNHIRYASPSIQLVSLSDKLHNARCILSDYRVIGETIWTRFNAGKKGTLWYYRALVSVFSEAGANAALLQELDLVVSELEQLAAAQEVAQV